MFKPLKCKEGTLKLKFLRICNKFFLQLYEVIINKLDLLKMPKCIIRYVCILKVL